MDQDEKCTPNTARSIWYVEVGWDLKVDITTLCHSDSSLL